MTLSEADKLLSTLNEDYRSHEETLLTRFEIAFSLDGTEQLYKDKYVIGKDDKPLVEHIEKSMNSFLKNKGLQEKLREKYGEEEFARILENKQTILNRAVPTLNCHQSLDEQKERTESMLETLTKPKITTVEREFIEYSKAILDWVEQQRSNLNDGKAVNFFNPPQLEDYQYIMPENPEKIKTVYISGPITADPNYRERFKTAEESLSKAGYTAINPVELVKGKLSENMSAAETWRRAMEIDLEALRHSDAVVILDKKGLESMGMDIETHLATRLNIPLVTLDHILKWSKEQTKTEDVPAKKEPDARRLMR